EASSRPVQPARISCCTSNMISSLISAETRSKASILRAPFWMTRCHSWRRGVHPAECCRWSPGQDRLTRVFTEAHMRFSVRPVFVGTLALLTQIPLQLFLTLWAGMFFGGLTSSFLGAGSAPFYFFGALAFFGLPLVSYFGKKLNYSRTDYKFSDDRLEFEE